MNGFEGMIQPKFFSIAEFRNDFSIDASGKAGLFSILNAYDGSEVVISAYLQRNQNGQWTNINTGRLKNRQRMQKWMSVGILRADICTG